jgi:small subunit ribosomal protein S1
MARASKSTTVSPQSSEQSTTSPASAASTPSQPAKTQSSNSKPMTMADLLNKDGYQLNVPRRGSTIKGTITEVTKKAVIVDVGGKTEGVIADKEFEAAADYIEQLKPGDVVEAYVISSENERGQVLLSLKKAAMETKWQDFEAAHTNQTTVMVKGLDVNRGGMVVTLDGVRGFIPSSQFSKAVGTNFAALKGKKFEAKSKADLNISK